MSAYIVDRDHIDALVTAALIVPRPYGPMSWYWDNPTRRGQLDWGGNENEIGRMLWAENLRSVAYRYPNDESGQRPGPNDFTDDDVDTYTFRLMPGVPKPVTVLAILGCYEYQSCEHPEWKSSEAHAFCESLRHHCIRHLPGYSAGPWHVTDRNVFRDLVLT